MVRAIIIDDEPDGCEAIRMALVKHCPEVTVQRICNNPEDGLNAINDLDPDLVFLDIQMPGMTGFDLLQLIKLSGDFLNEYQEFRKKAAEIIVETVIPGKSGAESVLAGLIDQAIDLQTKFLKSYGVAVGQGKGKIGARHQIIPTKKVTGKLLTERTFVVALSPFDKVFVTIKKTGGKSGADIAVCAKYPNGFIFNEKRKSIDKGEGSKGDSVTFVLTDMAEKITTIHLVQTGLVTNTCEYSLTIEGEYDTEEMKNNYPVKHGAGAVRA